MSMPALSIVIITRNEAQQIADCIRSASRLTRDIIVVDSGSTDGTLSLAAEAGARVLQQEWQGYGAARNRGAAAAQHDWILALDADERLSDALIETLKEQELEADCAYRFRRRNHWQDRPIRFGAYGFDRITRLYHRGSTHWNDYAVHEQLRGYTHVLMLRGYIDHFGISDVDQFWQKKKQYAWLCALTYAQKKKKAGWVKRFLAPTADAAKSLLLLGGFLDGRTGWRIALGIYRYTALKYQLLHRFNSKAALPGAAIGTVVGAPTALPSSAAS
jgi:glycosyltransferase involved in cell wall biosynthesis